LLRGERIDAGLTARAFRFRYGLHAASLLPFAAFAIA
jgi:hypothetical protein